jgi:hypothetical protein
MLNNLNNFGNLMSRRGLYCAWIQAQEGENALISVWTDPTRKGCEPQTKKGEGASEGPIDATQIAARNPRGSMGVGLLDQPYSPNYQQRLRGRALRCGPGRIVLS